MEFRPDSWVATSTPITYPTFCHITSANMPSSKGEPTDPELREQVKEEVKAEEKGEQLPKNDLK